MSCEPVQCTLESFLANMPEMLGAFFGHEEPLAVIVDLREGLFLQFWIEKEMVIVEVASNFYFADAGMLRSDQELALQGAGWSAPQGKNLPNWRLEKYGLAGLREVTQRSLDALLHILVEEPRTSTSILDRTFLPFPCSIFDCGVEDDATRSTSTLLDLGDDARDEEPADLLQWNRSAQEKTPVNDDGFRAKDDGAPR